MGKSDASASFGIEVTDDTASGTTSAVSNLKGLKSALEQDEIALRNTNKALKNLNLGSVVNAAQVKKLREEQIRLKTSIAGNQAKYLQLGGSMKAAGKESLTLGQQLKAGLKESGGPIGEVSGGIGGLIAKLGTAGLAGVAVIAVAGIVALDAALSKFALTSSDAYRSEMLQLEALGKLHSWYNRSTTSADDLMYVNNEMAQKYGLLRSQVKGMTDTLYQQGYRGGRLQSALEATSIAVAAFGGDTAKANTYLAQQAYQFGYLGKGSKAFADRVKHDLGGLATKQAAGLSVQMKKLHENIGMLFEGINIEGFLTGLKSVTDLFSQSTVTGQAMKQILSTMFGDFFGSAEKGFPTLKTMLETAVLWTLELQNKFIELQIWIQDVTGMKWSDVQFMGIKAAVGLVAAGLIGISAWLATIITQQIVMLATNPFVWMAVVIVATTVAVYKLLTAIIDNWSAIKAFFAGLWSDLGDNVKAFLGMIGDLFSDYADIGKDLVKGIANGITSAATFVYDAIRNLASGSLKLFKTILGIHSPSVVFKMQGRMIGAGVAGGIRASQPEVFSATRSMISIPAANTNNRPSSGNVTVESGAFVFQIQGDNAKEIGDEIEDRINKILHGAALQLGAA